MNDKQQRSSDGAVSEQVPAAAKVVERGSIHTGEAVEIIGVKDKSDPPPKKK